MATAIQSADEANAAPGDLSDFAGLFRFRQSGFSKSRSKIGHNTMNLAEAESESDAAADSGTTEESPFNFNGLVYPGLEGGTCTDELMGLDTCLVNIMFTPTSIGTFENTITLTYENGLKEMTLELNLTGSTTGVLTSDKSTYAFADTHIGSTSDVTIALTNAGYSTITSLTEDTTAAIAAPFTFKGGTYPGTGGTCTDSLATESACTLVLTYAPTEHADSTATLKLSYNDGGSAQTLSLPLTAYGYTETTLSFSESTYDFGRRAIGSVYDRMITITSVTGTHPITFTLDATITLDAPYSFKGGTFPGTGGTCNATLEAGLSCTIVVSYYPTSTTSNDSTTDSFKLSYDDGDGAGTANQTYTFTVSGTSQTGWNNMSQPAFLASRYGASAVFTGTEIIVWGGCDSAGVCYDNGGKYNPYTDTWTAISTTNAPAARQEHTAIYATTSNVMVVWGGKSAAGTALNTGAIYNPTADTWTTINMPVGTSPVARWGHSSVYDSDHNRVLIWGGIGTAGLLTSGIGWALAVDSTSGGTWVSLNDATSNRPAARFLHTAVFEDSKMIVFGGCGSVGSAGNAGESCTAGNDLDSGAIYNVNDSSWTIMATGPAARFGHTSVWSGTEALFWGGATDPDGTGANLTKLDSGSTYQTPPSELWTAMASASAPVARYRPLGFWFNEKLLIYGGIAATNTGGLFNTTTGGWTAISTTGIHASPYRPAAVSLNETGDHRVFLFGGTTARTAGTDSKAVSIYAAE